MELFFFWEAFLGSVLSPKKSPTVLVYLLTAIELSENKTQRKTLEFEFVYSPRVPFYFTNRTIISREQNTKGIPCKKWGLGVGGRGAVFT